ncbi:hypothetical protein [Aeromonas hydrophila]|uniref:hypothetical protein n=1 Tax=Aeromonas hydrophila TaxID=644 RepID=UPI0011C0C043|nr:hypothetical protein [Aeromonas hydrophila]QEE13586.1 hypothetical protein C1A23_25385 [Aeromonas hydrophila subsp. hydrophila]
MKERVSSAIFSLNGLSMFIGVTGFISSLVTLIFDLNQLISVKWIIGLLIISVTIICILFKVIHDSSNMVETMPYEEKAIDYLDDGNVLVIRKNDSFSTGNIVSIYKVRDSVLSFIGFGIVDHTQSKIIQIKPLIELLPADVHSYLVSNRIPYKELVSVPFGNS